MRNNGSVEALVVIQKNNSDIGRNPNLLSIPTEGGLGMADPGIVSPISSDGNFVVLSEGNSNVSSRSN